MSLETLKTRFILLRKTPWSESSLIISGVSPDYGRLDFLWRGARAAGKNGKSFPAADLFREYEVQFQESRREGSMPHLLRHDLLTVHDKVAEHYPCYAAVCGYARFLLKNTKPMLEIPMTYQAFSLMLTRLENDVEPDSQVALAKLVYLYENGLLSAMDTQPGQERIQQEVQKLIDACLTDEPYLNTRSEAYRKRFSLWVLRTSESHGLEN